jgi:hypothetical protein
MKAAVAIIACAIIAGSLADVNTVVPEEFMELTVTAEEACNVDVSKCFAQSRKYSAPQWKQPVVDYSTSYSAMCAPEQRIKVAAKEKKAKKEANQKELCSKNERNQKGLEKKLKLGKKKEAYEKTVAEGKEKFLEKKVKSAQELTIKTAKKGQEESGKAAEKSNKAEDNLYKKECASKEAGFKSVREARQKVRVVYMPEAPAPAAKPKKAVKKAVKKVAKPVVKKVKVVTPAPAPAPVVIKKVIKEVIKPHKHHAKHNSLKEVLVKTGEQSEKAAAKSSEMVTKSNLKGEEAVHKEAIAKMGHRRHGEVETKKLEVVAEVATKKSEGTELKGKGEIKTKIAVEKVRKEGAAKEKKSKKVAPIVKVKCSPESSLENYVKGCKLKEEKFEKSKVANEAALKEVKKKASEKEENIKCDLTHNLCREIYKESTLREEKVSSMVADHDKELRAAMLKTENFETEEAAKMKFNICKSAANDMSYFAKKFLYGVGA